MYAKKSVEKLQSSKSITLLNESAYSLRDHSISIYTLLTLLIFRAWRCNLSDVLHLLAMVEAFLLCVYNLATFP